MTTRLRRLACCVMRARTENAGVDPVDLGALLVLLHHGVDPMRTVEVTYPVWRHQERSHAAFVADADDQRRRGASHLINFQ